MINTSIQENFSQDTTPESEIITRILQGEKELYALIVRRHNQRLYRIAMAIVNDDVEVEDVMQVAYIKAYENLGKFAFQSSFSTWLTRILINESLLRIRIREKSIHLNGDTFDMKIYQQHTIESKTPVTELLNLELKVALERAIRQLPEKYRVVFIMREIENMNTAETQECLEISEVNVKVRLNRAKSMLKDSLSRLYKKDDILHFHLTRCGAMVEKVMMQLDPR
jgi:RNA polymerase sigma factor (sigma-70 family)